MSQQGVVLSDCIGPKQRLPRFDRWLLTQFFKSIGPAPIRVVLKSGAEMAPRGVSPVATVSIQDYRTLARLAIDPEMAFGDGYASGSIQVTGELLGALEAVYESWPAGKAASRWYSV